MLTDEQKSRRKTGIYGTDASIICGKNPYKTPYQLWQEKTGLVEEEDISHKPVIKAGNYLEEPIRRWFESEADLSVQQIKDEFHHNQYEWMRGHVDGLVTRKLPGNYNYMPQREAVLKGDEIAVFEAKTASYHQARNWGEPGELRVPVQYLLQVAHYMAITDLPKTYMAVLIGGNDFRIYNIDRNPLLEAKLIEREKHFWEVNVQQNIPPEFLNAEDVLKGCDAEKDAQLLATDELMHVVEMLQNTDENIKSLEEEKSRLKDIICLKMREKEILVDAFENPLITWKQAAPTKRFDTERFKTDNPELYSQYVKQDAKGSRRFLIK